MHTTTSKAVLTPLADAVSSLIVIVSDAETDGTAMPNLNPLAKGVEAQIANLVNVGKRIEGQPNADAQLKRDMPVACGDVTKSAELLVSSTGDLVTDPYSAKGRQDLLQAVKGILSGTTAVLNVFDDAEVRKIISACAILRAHLDTISRGPSSPAEAQQFVQVIAQASQTIVVLAQLTNKRVAELLFLVLQTRLKAAIALLTKESPVLIGACKLSLTQPQNEAAKASRTDTCDRLKDAVTEIEIVVQFHTEDEGLAIEGTSDVGKIRKALAEELFPKVLRALGSEKPQEIQKAMDNQSKATSALVQHAAEYGHAVRDSVQRAQIEDICEELASTQQRLNESAEWIESGAYTGDGSAAERYARLREDIDRLNARAKALQTAMSRAVISDAGSVIGNLSDPNATGTVINRVHLAAHGGKKSALADDLEAFGSESGRLEAVVSAAIDTVMVSNPQTAQELRIARDRNKGLSVAYAGAAKLLAASPQDPAAREHYRAVSGAWEDSVKDIQKMMIGQEGVFKAEELMSGTKSGFEHHARSLAGVAAEGNIAAAHEHAALLITSANQFIAVAQKEAENTEDADYKLQLELKIHEVQSGIPDFLTSAQFVLDSFTSSSIDAAFELSSVVKGLTSKLSDLGNVIRSYKGGEADNLMEQLPPKAESLDSVNSAQSSSGKQVVGSALPDMSEFVPSSRASVDQSGSHRPSIGKVELPELGASVRNSVDHSNAPGFSNEKRSSTASARFGVPKINMEVLTEQMGDVVLVEEEKPVLLSEEEAIASPIKAAAQELKVVASNWSARENPIVQAVSNMSQNLHDLGSSHFDLRSSSTPGIKKVFISAAQRITSESVNVCKSANLLVDVCKDKRLKAQLSTTVNRIETLGQQLKIVAAVKASAPTDRDQDAILVQCANNLMGAVKACVSDCESASLRVTPEVLDHIGVKFRRQIHLAKVYDH
ncbi:Vinculin/alpha-catenin [Powellomyces hirtus]|nr:Vinculin/alpha-catenin [Powellomyces hirtus]